MGGCLAIGMKASFSAGLIIGVVMLLANNPRKNRRQLPYRELFKLLAMVFAVAAIGAGTGAAIGWHGGWNGHRRIYRRFV